jgi:hypothetical protein
MPQALPVGAKDYYEFFPTVSHRAGDIWSDLPTLGMLSISHAPGLVITPACDLQNNKVESITYLPIVSIRQAFCLRGFFPEVRRVLDAQLSALGLQRVSEVVARYVPLEPGTIDQITEKIAEVSSKLKPDSKQRENVKRALIGIKIIRFAYGSSVSVPTGADLCTFLGDKQFSEIMGRIVTNGYKSDVHFLPPDLQQPEWSVIPDPSLVLFRFPLSAPIEIFDNAEDTQLTDWMAEVSRLSVCAPGAEAFRAKRPMKRQTLRPRFLADLITRYVSMHVRLGAPDFTDDGIEKYIQQVKERPE